jgi:hypothetical protein
MGGAWVSDWWQQASSFRDLNVSANGEHFVSIPGFVENLAGSDASLAIGLGYVVAAVLGLAVAYFWWRSPNDLSLERFALAAAAVAIAAPQTLYYDSGLVLLGLAAILPRLGERAGVWVAVGVALSWLQLLTGTLGWSPLGPVTWMAAAVLAWRLVSTAAEPTLV